MKPRLNGTDYIPSTAYYESRHYEDKTKQKIRISAQEEEIFNFTRLYSNWLNKETGGGETYFYHDYHRGK
ncbi:hypothetical protein [Flavobacterium sp. TAB 87]|uniref:hypothetical protein n=1 Tax=Flavobacterium sp. TAB 87 TaxID=1729581 RepID=UPI00076BF67F|nr:hypothetical protein [Flavobacterium sp. TAB 87]KVV16400.1 hypothetical protein AP058_00078 [Flavobacterium sp. TAB 87]